MEPFKDPYGILELVAAKEPLNEDDENTEMEAFLGKLETILQNAQNQNPSNPIFYNYEPEYRY